MRTLGVCLPLLCVGLLMMGCEGDTGPAGPAGSPGTANVIYSEWFSPPTWIAYGDYGTAYRSFTMDAPLLTQDILDHGAVLAYLRPVGYGSGIVPLPFVEPSTGLSFVYRVRAGAVTVLYYSVTSPTVTPYVIPSENQLRYVLIPGGVVDSTTVARGGARSETIAGLQSLTYEEVRSLFNLPD